MDLVIKMDKKNAKILSVFVDSLIETIIPREKEESLDYSNYSSLRNEEHWYLIYTRRLVPDLMDFLSKYEINMLSSERPEIPDLEQKYILKELNSQTHYLFLKINRENGRTRIEIPNPVIDYIRTKVPSSMIDEMLKTLYTSTEKINDYSCSCVDKNNQTTMIPVTQPAGVWKSYSLVCPKCGREISYGVNRLPGIHTLHLAYIFARLLNLVYDIRLGAGSYRARYSKKGAEKQGLVYSLCCLTSQKDQLTGKNVLKRILAKPLPILDDPIAKDLVLYLDEEPIALEQSLKDFIPAPVDQKPRLKIKGQITEVLVEDFEMSQDPNNW